MQREDRAVVEIRTERLLLRTASTSDARAIARYYTRNRTHLTPFEPARAEEFYTEEYWLQQVQRNREEHRAGVSLRLLLFSADEREPIGIANFSQIFRGAFHACYLGYSLAEDAQGHGYMQEALRAATGYVFREIGLHRIMANYVPHNVRSGRLLRALGFVVEGYARDYLLINGRWEDHILTSLSNPAWPAPPAS